MANALTLNMNVRRFVKVTGIVGFIISVVDTYALLRFFVLPIILPVLMRETLARLRVAGVPISQAELSSIVSITSFTLIIVSILTLLISWLIQSALLMGLFRAVKVKVSFTDSWLISGNYFYVGVVTSAVIALTPMLNYEVNTILAHEAPLMIPQFLALNIASVIAGSALLTYVFSRVYNVGFIRAFVPVLVSLTVFTVIALVRL